MFPSPKILVLATASLIASADLHADEHRTTPYNVVWTVPGKDATGSMPLGNGELGINLWIEENGDLLFYLSRNDSFTEVSQLCKVGQVRVSLSPNPFITGAPFRQELILSDGVCKITAGKPESEVKLKVFVDAAHPVVHVVGESSAPLTVSAKVESWRTEQSKPHSSWTLMGSPVEHLQAADVFPPARPNSVSWYHRNETSPAFESTIQVQSLEPIRHTLKDPVLHRTFGGWVTSAGFKSTDDRTLASSAPVKSFALRVASPSSQTATADDWLKSAEQTANQSSDPAAALTRTAASWRAFWDRSWVLCEAEQVGWSRTTLDLRFKELLGRAADQEIRRVRLDHARHLLAHSRMSLNEVARVAGLGNAEYLSALMRKHHQMTPLEYRQVRQQQAAPFPQPSAEP